MPKRTISWNASKWAPLFFTIWTGQTLSWVGSAVAQFGLVWWVTAKTGSATILALATLLSMLPGVVLGPVVGALIDRWNRRIVMLVADGIIALASLGLAYLFWVDSLEIWHVYIIMLIRAVGGTFHWPANQASISLMVPKEHLPRIGGLNQTIGGAVNIISPPVGALLLQIMPLYWIMMIDVITAVFSILPLLFIMIPQPDKPPAEATTASTVSVIWGDMKAGFRYIWNWSGLFWLLILVMLINFFVNPAMSLVPILVTRYFQGGALELGWLNASWGVGMLVGGLVLGVWGGFRKRTHTMLLGIVGLGIGILMVAIAPANLLPLALAGFFLGSAMNAITNGSGFALLQTIVEPELQGRVFTVVMSMAGAISPLSLAVGGPIADWLGVRTLYFIAGVALILLAVIGTMSPVILNLEQEAAAIAIGQPAPAPGNPGPSPQNGGDGDPE
jgi:DHA3 family macrolide efflux protein-like MFS transporter